MNQEINFKLAINNLLQQKADAIKAVYRQWGNNLVRALKRASPEDRGRLKKSIGYRVLPRGKVKPGETIRLLVGILDPKSPALKYLRFILKGTRRHFVPVKTRGGRYTGILGWAQRHRLVVHKDGKWVWASGARYGKEFTGMYLGIQGDDFFQEAYNKYKERIEKDIRKVLEGR